jgi:hypothetical protein
MVATREPSIGAAFEALILVLESPRWIIRTSGMTSSQALFADGGLRPIGRRLVRTFGVKGQQSVRQAVDIRSAWRGGARKRLRAFLQTEREVPGILLGAIVVALI